MKQSNRVSTAFGLVVLTLSACTDDPGPTEPQVVAGEEETEAAADAPGQLTSTNAVFADRMRLLPADEYDLVSSPQEAAEGHFAFLSRTGSFPDIERDDFVIAEIGGQPVLRRVLQSDTEDGALVLETGHAWWHEVVLDGTVEVNFPFDGSSTPSLTATGPQRAPLAASATGLPLPPIGVTFDEPLDLCAEMQKVIDLLGGEQLCGEPVDLEYGAGVTVKVAGTLDSLRIESGDLRVRGDMDLAMTVESGGISGGSAPKFYPCNQGNYLGCISTPTGANLIDWLRRYAPNIPEGSLPPVRLCVPGTPIRVARGYWSGFIWYPPKYVLCRITDLGTLPTITLPSLKQVDSETRPHVTGDIVIRAVGDGEFEVKVAIPYVALSAAYTITSDIKAKASIGVFVLFRATVKNGGGSVRFTIDDTGRLTQTWSDQAGWDGDAELTETNRGVQLLELTNPDSIVVRVGVPVEAQAEICIAITSCDEKKENQDSTFAAVAAAPTGLAALPEVYTLLDDPTDFELQPANGLTDLNIGAKLGVGMSMFYEGTWSREQVHPTDPDIDNWHIGIDAGYDFTFKAGVTIPFKDFVLPDVPLSYENTWPCCIVRLADYWGQAKLNVTTTTTGSDLDPDGYTVNIERTDSLPDFVAEGATRVLPWSDELEALSQSRSIGVSGSVLLGQGVAALPCNALYSDAYLTMGLAPYAVVNGLRAVGVGIPNYALTTPCPFLVAGYRVELAGVAENCTVTDGAVRDEVWLQQRNLLKGLSDTKELNFEVVCASAADLGNLRVVMDPDAAGEGGRPHVLVDGMDQGPVPENDTLVVQGLVAGDREVAFEGVSEYCTTDPVTVAVVAGGTVEAEPPVSCVQPPPAPTNAVHFEATLEGSGTDANGYELRMDGMSVDAMDVVGRTSVDGIPADEMRAYLVADIDPACVPLEDNPRSIALDAGGNSVTVPFPVRCYDEPVDTLSGIVEGLAGSIAQLRTPEGASLVINGPKASELARMTGAPVRAWGATSATGFRVHGYEIRDVTGEERWTGILLDRADGTWLIGLEAREVIDPPDALRATSGSYVWIKGVDDADRIRPTLFGVIREGS
jgi:hypothetical protein